MSTGLGNITGTLQGMDALTLLQAVQQQEEQALAAHTREATQAANEAAGAYQGAAARPAPPLDIFSTLIPSLFGNVASVLSGNPVYQEQGQQRVRLSRAEQLQARADNLASLQDVWKQKAEAAQRAGDLEQEAKSRASYERLHQAYERVNTTLEHVNRTAEIAQQGANSIATQQADTAGRLREIAATGQQARLTQAERPKLSAGERSAFARQGLDPDSGLMLPTFAQREITRRNTLAKAHDESTRNQAFNEIRDIAFQRWSSDTTEADMGRRLLAMRHPFYKGNPKEARYFLTDEKVYRKIKGQWSKDPEAERRAKIAANEVVAPFYGSRP